MNIVTDGKKRGKIIECENEIGISLVNLFLCS
jgi:hypothetical protein